MEENSKNSEDHDSRKDDKESNNKDYSKSKNSSQSANISKKEEETEDDNKSDKKSENSNENNNNNKNEIKNNDSYSSFSLKPEDNKDKKKSKKNSDNSDKSNKSDSEKDINNKIYEKEQILEVNNSSEIKSEEEEENHKKKTLNKESDDEDEESEEEKEAKNIKKTKNLNNSKNDLKTLKGLFGAVITEESLIVDNDDDEDEVSDEEKGCNTNDLAIIFLNILLNQKEDVSIIFNRKKIQSIIANIEEKKNYAEIFKDIQNNELRITNLYEQLKDNKRYIEKPILLIVINPNEQIEVEFYKYGKTFSNSIRKRFGIIINSNFYSSTQPLQKFDDKKAKNKTKYILNSKEIIKENLQGNENEYDKKNNIWHNEEKAYRIRINYMTDKNKLSSFFVYCEGEKERNEIFQLIKLTQMKLNIKDSSNIVLKKMQKTIKRNNAFYGILKILAVKKKLKNKKIIKKYINNIIGKDKQKFNEFADEIKNKIKLKYIEQRKFFFNKGINRDMKHLILNRKFLKNKSEITINETNNIDNITKAVNKIYDFLKKPNFIKDNPKRKNYISFPVKDINNNDENSNDINLSFSYKNICINSSDNEDRNNNNSNIYLNKEQIFDISNVIYNFSLNDEKIYKNNRGNFNILILGPYINSEEENNIYFDIKIPKNKYMKNAYDKLINNKKSKIDFLVCQLFNCEINKSEIKNFNFASSITPNDYFFIKIIGGKNNNCSIQTKLYNPKRINENLIILELNIELILNFEFFNNKNEEIKLILYHIPKSSINKSHLMDTIILDYINKNEIKKLYLNLNMIRNRTYETPFDQCKKSKMFWNLIPFYQNKVSFNILNNDNNYNYKSIPFFSKNLKIGNKFYYSENINQDKISSLINNKDIPSYYKYEKIERYLHNSSYYHAKEKIKENIINNNPSNILNFNKENINQDNNKNTSTTDIKEIKGGLLNLCEYLGINENEEIFFHNLFTNEYKWRKFDQNKFIIIQNNSFNIINNEEMYNFNKDTNEKFIYSFQWYKLISFKNEIQMLSFIEILKKLRRLCINDFFNTKNIFAQDIKPMKRIPENEIIYGQKINEELLYDVLKEDENSKNNFNIIMSLNKIEFKNDFFIDYDSIINLEIISKSLDMDIKNDINLFEIFMNNMRKYNNRIIENNYKINSLKKNKTDNNESYKVCFMNKISLNENYFNKNNDKIINGDLLPENEKLINMNIDIAKDNIIQINLDIISEEEEYSLYSNFDINKDIFNSFLLKKIIKENENNGNYNYNNIIADFLVLPIYLSSENNNQINDSIIGILTFQIICINYNNNRIKNIDIDSYNNIYDKLISDYIYLCFKKGNNIFEISDNENDEKGKEKELINILGTYEPNIFKNVTLYKLYEYYRKSLMELIKENDLEKINNFIKIKGLVDEEYIANLNDYNSKYLFNKLSKYLYKYKRNNFYYHFTENSWINLLINLQTNNDIETIDDIYYSFPSKEKLISLYKKKDNIFFKIRDLMYMGLPNDISRKIIWDKLLNINNLVNKTANKLIHFKIYDYTQDGEINSSNNFKIEYNKEKGEIYTLLNDITKNNFLDEYFSIMDTIIDLDIMNLKEISNNDYNNFEIIKQITKTFYQWTLLNIGSTSEANAINKASEIKDMNEINYFSFNNQSNIYCYYSGILYLSDKLFNYFKSPSETFWYLIGLSQVIPMFNIKYNSYELSIYILVIKLILEQHHFTLYSKLLSLNFPFEYFISKHIASYYSSFFYDIDLYMKIADILIFESAIAVNNRLDSINHLRFLCSIALTILVENENKILSVDNIFQLENLFKVLKFKTYNNQLFFKKIYDNINNYFIDIDSKNNDENNIYSNENKKWDNKRKKIEQILDKDYYSSIRNNYKYMEKKFKNLSLIIHNNYIPIENLKEDNNENKNNNLNDNTNRININIWKYIIRNFLYNHDEENKNNQKNILSRGVLIILREIKKLNFDKENNFNLIGKYNFDCFIEKGKVNKINNKIIINENGQIYNMMNNSECLINYKYYYKDYNILLFSLSNEKNEELFQFKLNLNNTNLLKPIRLEIHSHKSSVNSNFAILEISILKYNDFILNDNYCNLYLCLFSPNDYKIDNEINKKFLEIDNFPIIDLSNEENDNEEENICKNIYNNYHEKLPLIYRFYLDKYFLCDNKSFNEKITEETIIEIKKIISELFIFRSNENHFIEDIVKWFRENKNKYGITIMEILIYLYLDNNIMNQNGNDILYNLFCFTSLNNKKNIVTISLVIELIYSLYKKYCIYYSYNDVKRMVNYYFQKEKYPSIKSVIIFNYQEIDKIEEIIKNRNRYDIQNNYNNIDKTINYIDITVYFIYIMNNFEEICKLYGIYNNKLDINPQSKNNVILILKIILPNLFLKIRKNEDINYDYKLYDSIVIEYLKEYTNEEFYFSFEFNEEKNLFDVSFKDNDKKYSNKNDNQYNYNLSSDINTSIYESILFYANNNFLFNNINNDYIEYDISFYEFKNLFFSLPYLNDLLWKNCYKVNNAKKNISNNNLSIYKSISNKNILYDRVNINVINYGKKIVQFIFVSNTQPNKNLNYSPNFSHSFNSIIINYNIYSNIIIKRLYDIINNKIEYQDLSKYSTKDNNFENDIQLIKDSLSDFKNVLFYSINSTYNYNYSINHYNDYLDNNSKYHFLEPLLPLYINFNYSELKNNSINFNIDITYSFWKKRNNIIKNKGYAKFPLNSQNDFYQWRKSLIQFENIKSEDKKFKIKFDCFNKFNKYEKKMKKLFSPNIEGNENNDKENNIEGNIISFNDDKYIGKNILVNRNNNYNCL